MLLRRRISETGGPGELLVREILIGRCFQAHFPLVQWLVKELSQVVSCQLPKAARRTRNPYPFDHGNRFQG